MSDTTVIPVGSEYDVTIGGGVSARLGDALPPAARKVLVVHPPTLGAAAAELRERLLADGGREVLLAEIPDAEAGKRIEVAAFCWQIMGQADFTRTDVVVGFGGGAVTDLAGFVAASWLRGVAIVQVPTTVLGMVDAAVGGKTGVNTAEGKNLVGAFWAPRAVLADLDLLRTLPENEVLAGFAEVVKAGFIRYPEILDIIEADPARAVDVTSAEFRRCIELAIRMKAEVVSADFREAGEREILNYGHTLGHAIERHEKYAIRHGEAVAIGCVYVAELARLAGRIDADLVDRHRSAFARVGLPTSYDRAEFDDLLAAMRVDKKARGNQLRFVVLDGIGRPSVLAGPSEEQLRTAYERIRS